MILTITNPNNEQRYILNVPEQNITINTSVFNNYWQQDSEGVWYGNSQNYVQAVTLDPEEMHNNFIELPQPGNQFVDQDIPEADRYWLSSVSCPIEEVATMDIAFFTKTVYIEGQPVTTYIMSVNRINNIQLEIGVPNARRPINNNSYVLSGQKRPRISFDVFKLRDTYGDLYPSLLVTLWAGGSSHTIAGQCYFTLSYLAGLSPVPEESTTPAVTPLGGFGSRDNTTAGLDFPDITIINQASVIQPNSNAHGIHIYALSLGQYNDLYAEMWSTQLSRQLRDTKYSPMQGIGSLHKMACTSPAEPTADNIKLAGATLQTTGYIVQQQFVKTVFPYTALDRYSGTFLDFAPHTKVSVHLPYIGTVNVDPDCCIGGGLQVCYVFDVLQGNCCAILKYTNRFGQSDIYGSYTGNCAYQSIVSGSDNGFPAVRGAVQTLATGAVNLAEGNMPGAALAALSAGTSLATAEHSFSRTGNTGGNAAALGSTDLYITVTSPQDVNTVENDVNYRVSNVGYPAAGGGTVGSYEGHWLEGIIHADLADATEAEKAEIERRIRGGLYI